MNTRHAVVSHGWKRVATLSAGIVVGALACLASIFMFIHMLPIAFVLGIGFSIGFVAGGVSAVFTELATRFFCDGSEVVSPPVVDQPAKMHKALSVTLTDDTQASSEKAEAIYGKLKNIDIRNEEKALGYLLIVCSAASLQDRNFFLNVHKIELAKFREEGIINQDNTIDEETRRVVLCAVKKNQHQLEIHPPTKITAC